MIITFQEFQKHEADRAKWLGQAIAQYRRSEEYKVAQDADKYDQQLNTTIHNFVKLVYDVTGVPMPDFTSSNHRLASNFFHRFTVQRNSYLLGNGVSFASRKEKVNKKGETIFVDKTKDAVGKGFDSAVMDAGLLSIQQKVSYVFYNDGEYNVFSMMEYMPIKDAETGEIRAGARFYSLDWNHLPITVELFEEDGMSVYRTAEKKYGLGALELKQPKQAYKQYYEVTKDAGERLVREENYSSLPVIPLYANKKKTSALVGMKPNIDAYDLIKSGFCNDETDVAQIYWMLSNASGMQPEDVEKFRDRLLFQHVAVVDGQNVDVSAHSQEVPYNSREAALNRLENDMYRDFGAVDVTKISGGQNKTATEINAAYQPLDEEVDEYEKQVTKFIKRILALIGIEDEPVYKRNRIVNEKEMTETVLQARDYLDERTILEKLPFVTVDEVPGIMSRRLAEDTGAFKKDDNENEDEEDTEE